MRLNGTVGSETSGLELTFTGEAVGQLPVAHRAAIGLEIDGVLWRCTLGNPASGSYATRRYVHKPMTRASDGTSGSTTTLFRSMGLLPGTRLVFEGTGHSATEVHAQARGWQRHLLREANGAERLQLRPDVVIGAPDQTPAIVLDTKWKSLDAGASTMQGVPVSDVYQLYAYAQRYGAAENVLVYPLAPGLEPRRYELLGTVGQSLSVRFFDLGGDLLREERQRVTALFDVAGATTNAARTT